MLSINTSRGSNGPGLGTQQCRGIEVPALKGLLVEWRDSTGMTPPRPVVWVTSSSPPLSPQPLPHSTGFWEQVQALPWLL